MSCKLASEHSVHELHCPAKPPVPSFLSQDQCLLNWKSLVPSEDSHLGLPCPGERCAGRANGCSGKRLGSSCLLLLRQNFLGSLSHSETTIGTPMLPGNLSYSLFDHALCCGFQHEKDTEERCSWGLVCCLVGFLFFIFYF